MMFAKQMSAPVKGKELIISNRLNLLLYPGESNVSMQSIQANIKSDNSKIFVKCTFQTDSVFILHWNQPPLTVI